MIELENLKRRLEEAEGALHRLLMGELEVSVTVGGYGATTYAQTDIDKLSAYISRLKSKIALKEGRPRRGPLYMKF